jgi:hypothetical protein
LCSDRINFAKTSVHRPACRHENPAQAKFCPECGRPVGNVDWMEQISEGERDVDPVVARAARVAMIES